MTIHNKKYEHDFSLDKFKAGKKPFKSTLPLYRMYEVRYLGSTDTQGSRVKIIDTAFGNSKTIPYSYKLNNVRDMAEEYLKGKGIKLVGYSATETKDYLLSKELKNFSSLTEWD